ncbi:hypothetical protein ILYODFUR_032805 [Ilyodon furcidens]|uniref:Uncharacterized protein n=1 Tax=Ilyodon furcidens TaxID=33524 RepID=A0ABV0UAD4_9TELE
MILNMKLNDFNSQQNLLTFLLSSSSRNGRVEEESNSHASFCRSRYVPPLLRPVRHTGIGNKSLFSVSFIIPGDARAATSVELCMLNCATQSVYPPKMDDPNTLEGLCFSASLRMPWAPPVEAGGGVWEEGSLGVSTDSSSGAEEDNE